MRSVEIHSEVSHYQLNANSRHFLSIYSVNRGKEAVSEKHVVPNNLNHIIFTA